MDRHYDLTYINEVFQGNETMVQQIVRLFLEQSPVFRREMTECIRRGQWCELHPIAHKLKSSVKMLGMTGLMPLVVEIERKSKFGEDVITLPQLVSELNGMLESLCITLTHDLHEVSQSSWVGQVRLRRA